jgi:hypothetical protein
VRTIRNLIGVRVGWKTENAGSPPDGAPDDVSVVPAWVTAMSSEANLCFLFPLIFWIFASAGMYLSIGWGKDFRVITSVLWGGVTVFSLVAFFIFLIATSVLSKLINTPSIKSPFSAYYIQALRFRARNRNLILALGVAKALILTGGFVAIVGGVWTIGLWLSSGVFLKVGV